MHTCSRAASIALHAHEAGAAARDFDRQAAEKFALAVDHARLAAVVRHEARALAAQPGHGVQAFVDQRFRQIGVGAIGGQAVDVFEIFLARVGAEIAVGDFIVGQFGDAFEVVDRFVGETHHAAGKAAVAARIFFAGGFEYKNFGAVVGCRECGAKGGIALAHNDHVVLAGHGITFEKTEGM